MNEIKSVLICGLGAIGSIYAAAVKDSGIAVPYVLVDETRFERYKAQNLLFNDKEYEFDYVLPSQSGIIADLVIIATKNDALVQVVENIKNFVGKETIILCLANGITSEELLKKHYDNILYSYIIGHTSFREGRSVRHDGVSTTVFGEKCNGEYSHNVLLVKEFFERIGLRYEIPFDMEAALWEKFMLNVGINQVSAVLKIPFGIIQTSGEVLSLTADLMKEVRDVAKAVGINNPEGIYVRALENIKKMLPEGKSSMLQDIEAKRPTEVEYFAGKVIELGHKYNVETPVNKVFYKLIRALEI